MANSKEPLPPLLFGFREMRLFQSLLAMLALASGIATAVLIKAWSDSGNPLLMVAAVVAALLFIWMFSATLRAPTSFVAVGDEITRIRFGGFVDTRMPNTNIIGAELTKHWLPAGIGVRTNFRGDVALVSTTGAVARLTLRQPIRIWIIPRLVPVRARRITLSVRNPQKLVERFGAPAAAPLKAAAKQKRQRGS